MLSLDPRGPCLLPSQSVLWGFFLSSVRGTCPAAQADTGALSRIPGFHAPSINWSPDWAACASAPLPLLSPQQPQAPP